MGLNSLPVFGIGITLEIFHSDGKELVVIAALNTCVICGKTKGRMSLMNFGLISSCPIEFDFMEVMLSRTSL